MYDCTQLSIRMRYFYDEVSQLCKIVRQQNSKTLLECLLQRHKQGCKHMVLNVNCEKISQIIDM